jgi:hypothetical protein
LWSFALVAATAGRQRRPCDIEAVALATTTVLLGRPFPDVLATARVSAARDLRTIVTVWGTCGVRKLGQVLELGPHRKRLSDQAGFMNAFK